MYSHQNPSMLPATAEATNELTTEDDGTPARDMRLSFVLDDELNILEVNEAFAAKLSDRRELLAGAVLDDVLQEADASTVINLMDSLLLRVPGSDPVSTASLDGFVVTLLTDSDSEVDGRAARFHVSLSPTPRSTQALPTPPEAYSRLNQFLEILPVPIAFVDAARRFRIANVAYADHLGRPLESILDQSVETVLGSDLSTMILQPLMRALRGESVSYERLVGTRNQGKRWFQVSLLPDLDAAKAVRGVYVIPRDVHQLKLAYQSLREHEEHLRDVIDSIPSPAAYLGPGMSLDYVNLAFARWRGQPRATLLGKPLASCVEPAFADQVHEPISRALQGERATAEVLLRFPDDTERWVQCHFEPRLIRGNVAGVYCMTADITEQKAAQEKLLFANQLIALHMQHTPLAVLEFDQALHMTRWSEQAQRLFGLHAMNVIGHSLVNLGIAHPEDAGRLLSEVAQLRTGEQPYAVLTVRNIAADGGTIWCEWHVSCLRNRHGQPLLFMALIQDVSERIESECRLQHAVTHDPLTSLPNRSMLTGQFRQLINEPDRPAAAVCMLFLDLDNFKDINDSLGHGTGDALLVEVARRIRSVIKDTDTLVRAGGDEFVVLAQDSADGGQRRAQSILAALREHSFLGPHKVYISASIGIAVHPADGADEKELLKCADAAMYQAKSAGKDTHRFYSEHIGRDAQRRLNLISALKVAIRQRSLAMHYQPIVTVIDGELVGAELLLRWNDADLGYISPAIFIPLAEENGLIQEIGDQVIEHAVRQCALWEASGRRKIQLSLNISPNQLRSPQFADRFIGIMRSAGCDPTWLKLEVTETCAVTDRENTAAMLSKLRDLGMGVALDDFGTGYSSLSLVHQLPITTIKIDQSFTKRIGMSSESTALVAGIVGLSHGLGLDVVAEGVETEDQLTFLDSLGCGSFQGSLFSMAVPPEEFESRWYALPSSASPSPTNLDAPP